MSKNKALIVIPARYASTRYPGKPLVELTGATGIKKTLIQRSWEAAKRVGNDYDVVVATDHYSIKLAAEGFGAEVVMTSTSCRNGTERCAEVAEKMPGYDVYVNLQGDAPLTPAWFVSELVDALLADNSCMMATPVLQCDMKSLQSFWNDRKNGRVGGTTVVFDKNMHALYFSKEVIPFVDPKKLDELKEIPLENGSVYKDIPVFHHVGCYAYKPEALLFYTAQSEGKLEKYEGLEQIRFLENGIPVKCVQVQSRGMHFWELNNPSDVEILERAFAENNIQ